MLYAANHRRSPRVVELLAQRPFFFAGWVLAYYPLCLRRTPPTTPGGHFPMPTTGSAYPVPTHHP